MTRSKIRDLGHGILHCSEPDEDEEGLAGHHRFLDELWLPSALSNLTPEQIMVINRYRESVIECEQQFQFANQARQTFSFIASTFQPAQVVEVGCGKFPIDVGAAAYLGVDIDEEALQALRAQGFDVCSPSDIRGALSSPADLILSSYAMHFAIDDLFLVDLAHVSSAEAIFCFNLIADDGVSPIALLGRMSEYWPLVQVVKTCGMSRREYFFVLGRAGVARKIEHAADRIRQHLGVASPNKQR